MRRRRHGVVVVLVAAWGCWGVPRPSAPHREPQLGVQLSSSSLANGLRVVIVEDANAVEVSVTMRYQVGEMDDPGGRQGTAHLVEHVLFEPVLSGESLYAHLQRAAVDFNGYTSIDATTFSARAPITQLARLLEVEATRLEHRCASVTDAAFTRQREIVRNELRDRGDIDGIFVAVGQGLYPPGHAYHVAAPATIDTVNAITREEACSFADVHYAPGNAVLVVGGPLSTGEVRAAITRTFGHVRRTTPARRPAAPVATRGQITSEAPVAAPTVLAAWPLPADPVQRARTRAVVGMTASLARDRFTGRIGVIETGGDRARMIALAIEPILDMSIEDALHHTRRAMKQRSQWLGLGLFEAAREREVLTMYSTLEPGIERDIHLADEALAGRDVATTIAAAIAGLRGMDRDHAATLAERLDLSSARVVVLRPRRVNVPGQGSVFSTPEHDVQLPATADPAEANASAPPIAAPDPVSRAQTRVLANGMRIVLLPLSSVPTVELRMVFPVGTGDEPADRRGVALLASHGLETDGTADADMLRFWMAGGSLQAMVDFDQTAFSARGLGTNLDHLLIGLGHVLRDGMYDSVRETWNELRGMSRLTSDETIALVSWRSALYGADHPYVSAGLWHRAAAPDATAVLAFHDANYVPEGATLIVAGGFDPLVANRWIDYVFRDWRGTRIKRRAPPARLQHFPFAKVTAGPQVTMRIAFSTAGKNRATAVVVAEMITQTIADVRDHLAASYGLHARLVESRLSTAIVITGSVDAQRASEAFVLVRDRLAALRQPSDDTAQRFLAARHRVIDRYSSIDLAATALAERAQQSEARDGNIGTEFATARAAAALTLNQLTPALAALDLDNAALLLSGPRGAVTDAYAAIGRRPVFLAD